MVTPITDCVNRYWALKNSWSMDGLPALHVAHKARIQDKIEPLKKMVGPLAPTHYQNGQGFGFEHIILVSLLTAIITVIVMRYGVETARAVAMRLPTDTSNFIHAPLRTMV